MPFPKLSHDELVSRQLDQSAIIKFIDGTAIRLRGTNFVLLPSELELDRALRYGVTRPKLDLQLAVLNDLLQRSGTSVARVLSAPEEDLHAERRSGETKTSHELPDLNLFFELFFPGREVLDVVAVLDQLNQLEIIEYAAPKLKGGPPPAEDIPPPTPDFGSNQGYFAAAPTGIDVVYARALPGGRGETLRVVDVERSWNNDHEDEPLLVSTSGIPYPDATIREHGTAVIGEIAAVENVYGMTGIAPSVEVSMSSPHVFPDNAYQLPDGIQRAYNQARSGDIILIEQNPYCNQPDQCPADWDNGAFSVIQTAVANGRIVIETAGNSTLNLDDSNRFGTRFNRNVEDSGAIYVGAGSSSTHAPLSFTNYGSRVDVQGWGRMSPLLAMATCFSRATIHGKNIQRDLAVPRVPHRSSPARQRSFRAFAARAALPT